MLGLPKMLMLVWHSLERKSSCMWGVPCPPLSITRTPVEEGAPERNARVLSPEERGCSRVENEAASLPWAPGHPLVSRKQSHFFREAFPDPLRPRVAPRSYVLRGPYIFFLILIKQDIVLFTSLVTRQWALGSRASIWMCPPIYPEPPSRCLTCNEW